MLRARQIMHPRLSLPAKEKGSELVKKLTCGYPALPVVDDTGRVIGMVSEYDVLDAIKGGRTVYEFDAETIMSCGHMEHEGVCKEPVTVTENTSIDDIVNIFYGTRISVLPVVEDSGKLVGIISRKNIINALAEEGFWVEHEFQKRV